MMRMVNASGLGGVGQDRKSKTPASALLFWGSGRELLAHVLWSMQASRGMTTEVGCPF